LEYLKTKTKYKKYKRKKYLFYILGQNIGTESYGKGERFLRPVIVYERPGSCSF
jgi:hypothetical protein